MILLLHLGGLRVGAGRGLRWSRIVEPMDDTDEDEVVDDDEGDTVLVLTLLVTSVENIDDELLMMLLLMLVEEEVVVVVEGVVIDEVLISLKALPTSSTILFNIIAQAFLIFSSSPTTVTHRSGKEKSVHFWEICT